MVIPNALVNAVRGRQAVLFAGAGLSVETIGVRAVDVRDAIGAQIANDYPGYDYAARSIEDVCDEYVAINDRLGLVNELAALIPKNAAPSAGASGGRRFLPVHRHDELGSALRGRVPADRAGLPGACGRGRRAATSASTSTNLLKIHGSVDRPLALIATTDDLRELRGYAPRSFSIASGTCSTPTRFSSLATACATSTCVACSRRSGAAVASGRRRRVRGRVLRRSADEAPRQPRHPGHRGVTHTTSCPSWPSAPPRARFRSPLEAERAAALVALEREVDQPLEQVARTGCPTPRRASRRRSSR